jgi:1-acyl-sn-glycerol-3-phosphate acyltransferase
MPIVPTIIHGARRALPPRSLIPRPGRIVVEILEPLTMAAAGHSAEGLRDESRRRILARLQEPDLATAAADR